MSLYRGLRQAETPWFERVNTSDDGTVLLSLEAAKKLRPRLNDVELNLWRDCANGVLAKNFNQKIAVAAADAAVEAAAIDDSDDVINKYEDD
jgi:hypothetical protein